jgi:hypothetical protein
VTFPKCRATQLSSHHRPLIWGMPPPRAFTFHITFGMLWGCCDEERSQGPQHKRGARSNRPQIAPWQTLEQSAIRLSNCTKILHFDFAHFCQHKVLCTFYSWYARKYRYKSISTPKTVNKKCYSILK